MVDVSAAEKRRPISRTGVLYWLGGAAVIALFFTPLGSLVVDRAQPLFDLLWSNMMTIALVAALVAVASTPLAFAVLGRLNYFEARRGRVLLKPSFASIVVSMMLVMGIPAIFAALVVKSQFFDKSRYEFDPNRTISVLDSGRGLGSIKEADEAIRVEMQRLAEERKNLVNQVKKVDESLLGLRALASQSPPVAVALAPVLEKMSGVRKSVGLDAPQQLMDLTASTVDIKEVLLSVAAAQPAPGMAIATPAATTTTAATAGAVPDGGTAVKTKGTGSGLTAAAFETELNDVPAPQKLLAAMLPLVDLPAGWTVGKLGAKHIESFNAENLYEKIDGRAESFLQYDVKGMAYAFFHPTGDETNEVQLYIFELASPLKALGKYGSEKPAGVNTIEVGTEGYASAGSTLFYKDRYYTQIVSTQDAPKFAEFALELARRVAAKQGSPATASDPTKPKGSTPESIFAMLPGGPGRARAQFVSQDVFGYSFLTDVFLADYTQGEATFQGFLRPYTDAAEAKSVLDKYMEAAKVDGAEIKKLDATNADAMIVSSNIGLVDVLFLKGNCLGGVNGATEAAAAEKFARELVKTLPASIPALSGSADAKSEAGTTPSDSSQ